MASKISRIYRAAGTNRLPRLVNESTSILLNGSNRQSVTCYRYYSNNNQKRDASLDASNASKSTLPTVQSLLSDANKLMTPVSQRILNNSRTMFTRNWNAFIAWYDEISHTNEIREAHKQVEELQEKLSQAQQLRREVSKELTDIRYKLQMCYGDLANCQKGDPKYIEIIRKEFEV